MKTLPKTIGTLILVLLGALASGSAIAQHRGHGHGHGYGHGGNVRFGISLGFPIFGPSFYPAPYYAYPAYAHRGPVYAYPPLVIEASPPPVYVERGVAPAPAQRDWYYCAASNVYYPEVGECPAGWQRVPAQAPTR